MTVFVVHPVRDDLAPALKFGNLHYINQRYINGDELDADVPSGWTIPKTFRRHLRDAAVQFNPNVDYLLIAGDHLQLLAFTAILFGKFNSVQVLRYDRRLNDYIPVRLHSGIVPVGGRVLTSGLDIGPEPALIGIDNGQDSDETERTIQADVTCAEISNRSKD